MARTQGITGDRLDANTRGSLMTELRANTYLMQERERCRPRGSKVRGLYRKGVVGDRGNWRSYTQLGSLNISKQYVTVTLKGGCLSLLAEHLVKLKLYQQVAHYSSELVQRLSFRAFLISMASWFLG